MTSAYQQLFVGLAAAIVLIYLLIVINFQIVDRSLRHRDGAADGTGRHRLDAVRDRNDGFRFPRSLGAIMCHGGCDRQQHSGDQLCPRNGWRRGRRVPRRLHSRAGALAVFARCWMTALAMVIGMLPMAVEAGQNQPLGRAVIGGLMFATCATLFLVPAIFSLVHSRQPDAANQAGAATPSSH